MDNVVIEMPRTQSKLGDLWEQILEKHLDPEDDYEVTALLESIGWTDQQARKQFGVADVFQLAVELRQLYNHPIEMTANQYHEKERFGSLVRKIIREFLRGMVFALPMVLSIAAMLTIRFSLWSYEYLSTRMATAIAVGTILSFITVGGFMQAMARQGYFYLFQGYYRMMQRVTFRIIFLGIVTSVIISIVGFAADIVFPELPYDMMLVALAYYLVLNAIWLCVAVLYIIRREIWFTALLAAGIGIVYVGFRIFDLNILLAQLIAMLSVAVGSVLLLIYFFKRDGKTKDRGINPPLPRASVTIYNVAPYFLYGVLYFSLLFCDRVMAWSTYASYVPFIIWFRGDYELGLDFALITLIIPMGLSEIVVSRLMTRIWDSQKDYKAKEYVRMNDTFARLYNRNVRTMAMLSGLNAILVYFVARWFLNHYVNQLPGHIQLTFVSNYVFIISLASYTILSIGLLHSVVMFSVSRPELVLRPILLSLGIDFVVGFLLTRWIGYPQAVWGLFAGCMSFTTITTLNVRSVLKNLDYHMYLLS